MWRRFRCRRAWPRRGDGVRRAPVGVAGSATSPAPGSRSLGRVARRSPGAAERRGTVLSRLRRLLRRHGRARTRLTGAPDPAPPTVDAVRLARLSRRHGGAARPLPLLAVAPQSALSAALRGESLGARGHRAAGGGDQSARRAEASGALPRATRRRGRFDGLARLRRMRRRRRVRPALCARRSAGSPREDEGPAYHGALVPPLRHLLGVGQILGLIVIAATPAS